MPLPRKFREADGAHRIRIRKEARNGGIKRKLNCIEDGHAVTHAESGQRGGGQVRKGLPLEDFAERAPPALSGGAAKWAPV